MKNTENKNERFVRIAESRTNKIVDMLRLLGNCSNRSTYEYLKKDIDKIFLFIDKEIKICKSKFEKEQERETKFKLK